MQKFLVIQTAFIGDVVLATGIIEQLHAAFPTAQIDFLLRKGNEGLLQGHPWLHEVLIWDKKNGKLKNLWKLGRKIRRTRYDKVINVQRFAATGLLTAFSGAKETIGFDKNPLSRLFTRRIRHIVHQDDGQTLHEIARNQELIQDFAPGPPAKPRLYPTAADFAKAAAASALTGASTGSPSTGSPSTGSALTGASTASLTGPAPYITVSPASVWFTKQYPAEKWIDFLQKVPAGYKVYLLGAPSDAALCEQIRDGASNTPSAANLSGLTPATSLTDPPASANLSGPGITNPAAAANPRISSLAGQLTFLQSAALMRDAAMNYVNDSAPMHFASALNAPVTAVYCSTIPSFGFGPLSDKKFVVETPEPLDCRPCGLHGYKACPLGHFNCAHNIRDTQLLETLLIL